MLASRLRTSPVSSSNSQCSLPWLRHHWPEASWDSYPEGGYTRQTIGGCGVWNADANWANDTQEDGHPSYWGQLALRNCVLQAYNGGAHVSRR